MATKIGSLYASMSLESASFVNGLKRVESSVDRTRASMDKAFGSMKGAIKGFLGVLAADKALDGARQYLAMADATKKMDAQLKLATAQFGNQAAAQADVNRIAKETRTGLLETTSLYSKMLPAARDLGKGQIDASRATETFTKALKIGGAGTAEAASATLQFGQALASGVLRGDEFNSINEASPRIMRLLAESMGQPVGALRKMAEEGKLTSDVLFKALTDPRFTASIDKEFKELPVTFGDAKTIMENSLTQLIGAFDRGSGISDGIIDGMIEGATSMENLVDTAEDAGEEMRATFAGLHDVFAPMLAGGNSMFDALGIRVASLSEQVRSILNGIDQVRNFLPDLQRKAQKWDEENLGFRTGFTGDHGPRSDLEGQFAKGYQRSRVASGRSRLIEAIRRNGTNKEFTGKGMSDQQLIAHSRTMKFAGPQKGSGVRITPPTKSDAKKGGGGADKAKREAERAAEEMRRNREAFEAELSRAQSQELDSRAALSGNALERFAFEQQALEQDRVARAADIDRDGPQGSKRYTEAQVAQLKQLNDNIAANKAEGVSLKKAQFLAEEQVKLRSASLTDAQDLASIQLDLARTSKERRDGELRLLDLQYEQEELALEAIVASRDATNAEKLIAEARLKLLPALRQGQQKRIERDTMGPLASYLDAIPKTGLEINEAAERVAVDGLENLKSGLLDCIKGTGDLGDAFGSLADTVINGLLDIALQQMLIKPLGSLLFGGEKGGGGLLGSIISGIAGAASGGKSVKAGKANGGLGNSGRWLVGEHGPELVDVGGPFNVTPNHKLKGVAGSAGGINVSFGAITSNDPQMVKAMAMEAIVQMQPLLTQSAVKATRADLGRPRM